MENNLKDALDCAIYAMKCVINSTFNEEIKKDAHEIEEKLMRIKADN